MADGQEIPTKVSNKQVFELVLEMNGKVSQLLAAQQATDLRLGAVETSVTGLKTEQAEVMATLRGSSKEGGIITDQLLLKEQVTRIQAECALRAQKIDKKSETASATFKSIVVPIIVTVVVYLIFNVIPHVTSVVTK